jgi:hypothetical protein
MLKLVEHIFFEKDTGGKLRVAKLTDAMNRIAYILIRAARATATPMITTATVFRGTIMNVFTFIFVRAHG